MTLLLFRVQTVKPNVGDQKIHLLAIPIRLHELGVYNVALSGHVMSGTWNPQPGIRALHRRKTFTSGVNKDLSGTEILSGDVSFNLPPQIQKSVMRLT